jgi:hypothetical protein
MAFGWLLVTGYWLLVTGYWLLVTGYWLLVTGYWLLVTGCWFVSCLGFSISHLNQNFITCIVNCEPDAEGRGNLYGKGNFSKSLLSFYFYLLS